MKYETNPFFSELTEFWWTETEASIHYNWARVCQNGSKWTNKEVQGGGKVFAQSSKACLPRKRWIKGSVAKAT